MRKVSNAISDAKKSGCNRIRIAFMSVLVFDGTVEDYIGLGCERRYIDNREVKDFSVTGDVANIVCR